MAPHTHIEGLRINNCGVGIVANQNTNWTLKNSEITRCGAGIIFWDDQNYSNFLKLLRDNLPEGRPEEVLSCLQAIENTTSKKEATFNYNKMISLLADHVTILTPFIPAILAHISSLS